MLRVLVLLVVLLVICHVTIADENATDGTPFLGKDVLDQLKNATDFKMFKQILDGIDFKAALEKANIDTSWIADIKSQDILKVNVFTETLEQNLD